MAHDDLNLLEAQIPTSSTGKNKSKASAPKDLVEKLLSYYQNGKYRDAEKLALSFTKSSPATHLAGK